MEQVLSHPPRPPIQLVMSLYVLPSLSQEEKSSIGEAAIYAMCFFESFFSPTLTKGEKLSIR